MELSITLIIIIVTTLVSLSGFGSHKVMDDLIFYPPAVSQQKQWWRFVTCGFIHADYAHLFFNMYSLYMFGGLVETQFGYAFGSNGKWLYLLMYLSSLFFCLLPTYNKNKNNYHYQSLGASGAVSAVVFAFIFLDPLQRLGPIGLGERFMIPGVVFGVLYLVISSYLDKKGKGNINHSAHIWGALYGIVFLAITGSFLAEHNLFLAFWRQVKTLF